MNIPILKLLPCTITVWLVLLTFSCKKFITLDTPPDSISSDKAFVDSSAATSVVLGLYGSIANGTATATGANAVVYNIVTKGAMSADEGYYLTSTGFDNFKNNTLAAGNDANLMWDGLYARIGRTNFAINGLSSATALSASLKNQLLGESKFWRAYLYFYLVNYYGDVPLALSTNALSNGLLPRTPAAQVYQRIVQDLTEAKTLLTTTYPSAEKARINRNVVSAFLARVYFYQQNWAAAEAEATAVISTGTYSLVTNLSNVFVNTSAETIWQISLAGTSTPATILGLEFIPAATTPNFVLYDTLANSFEANDQRKVSWLRPITYLSKTYYYPYKYKLRVATAGNEYPVMLRLSEMYLIRAEARAQQNNISDARTDLNVVRTRAGLANTAAATQARLLLALEQERRVELFTEYADRWFNLKRLNKATATLSRIKPAWQPFQQLYPIPLTAMASNPNLANNPGY